MTFFSIAGRKGTSALTQCRVDAGDSSVFPMEIAWSELNYQEQRAWSICPPDFKPESPAELSKDWRSVGAELQIKSEGYPEAVVFLDALGQESMTGGRGRTHTTPQRVQAAM